MKYCCATRKPLDCLFSFTLLSFLNTKVIHACHYKSDREEDDIRQWCPLSTPTHHPAVRCVLVWCASFHAILEARLHAFQPTYTDSTKLEFWPLLRASPTFSAGNQAFNPFFFLSISTMLRVSGVAITQSAGEMGWSVVDETQSWAPWVSVLCFLRDQWSNKWGHWVSLWSELVKGVRVDAMRYLCWPWCKKADSGDIRPSRRSWGEDGCSPLIAGSGIFCNSEWIFQDSYFSSLASCWGQCQGSLALPLEASPCCEKRWEQSILPLISNSGQILVGRLTPLAKLESASLGAQLSI